MKMIFGFLIVPDLGGLAGRGDGSMACFQLLPYPQEVTSYGDSEHSV